MVKWKFGHWTGCFLNAVKGIFQILRFTFNILKQVIQSNIFTHLGIYVGCKNYYVPRNAERETLKNCHSFFINESIFESSFLERTVHPPLIMNVHYIYH